MSYPLLKQMRAKWGSLTSKNMKQLLKVLHQTAKLCQYRGIGTEKCRPSSILSEEIIVSKRGKMTLGIDPSQLKKYVITAVKDFDPSDNYIASYPQMLAASKILIETMGSSGIPAISFMAYGWMPTILNYEINKSNNETIFSGFKVNSKTDACKLIQGIGESPVNNSWVGLSKLLHFINPKFFPIWDSRVAKHFNIMNSYQVNKKLNFLKYINFIHDNMNNYYIEERRMDIENNFNYKMSNVRLIELSLFVNSPVSLLQE